MKFSFKNNYKRFIDFLSSSMNGMAFGLFATLIIGVIIGQIGLFFVDVEFTVSGELYNIGIILEAISNFLKSLMGIGIGIGIAWALKLQGLKLISLSVVGALATSPAFVSAANPLVAYLVVILTITIVNLILRKKTPVDIIIVPLLSVIIGYLLTLFIAKPIIIATDTIGVFVNNAADYQPFLMGLVIAVVMGMLLTSPISSAAIAISIGITGIAAGAALAGCCVQMVGFAVMGRRDNDVGTTISVAIGTSMLQFKNIIKKPVIWLPTIIASAILGPLATLVFKSETTSYGAGMGTSGLVGPLQTYQAMGNTVNTWLTISLVQIILPIVIVLLLDLLFRKLKWYGKGDLKI